MLRGDKTIFLFLDFIEQQTPRDETIQSLLTRRLTFHLHTSRTMNQHDARGNLVHILAAVTTGAHKTFFDVRLAHAKRRHALRELIFFFNTDGKYAHKINAGVTRAIAPTHETRGPDGQDA